MSATRDGTQQFLVWFDPFFEEWFACPQEEVTSRLLESLGHMHAVPKEVEAHSLKEAIAACKPAPSSPEQSLSWDADPVYSAPHSIPKVH